jgi:hypothetical protein
MVIKLSALAVVGAVSPAAITPAAIAAEISVFFNAMFNSPV